MSLTLHNSGAWMFWLNLVPLNFHPTLLIMETETGRNPITEEDLSQTAFQCSLPAGLVSATEEPLSLQSPGSSASLLQNGGRLLELSSERNHLLVISASLCRTGQPSLSRHQCGSVTKPSVPVPGSVQHSLARTHTHFPGSPGGSDPGLERSQHEQTVA